VTKRASRDVKSDVLSATTLGAVIFPSAVYFNCKRRNKMTIGTILLIIVVLLLLGAIPTWPHSRGWGYAPSGVLGLVLVVLLILFLMGRL